MKEIEDSEDEQITIKETQVEESQIIEETQVIEESQVPESSQTKIFVHANFCPESSPPNMCVDVNFCLESSQTKYLLTLVSVQKFLERNIFAIEK